MAGDFEHRQLAFQLAKRDRSSVAHSRNPKPASATTISDLALLFDKPTRIRVSEYRVIPDPACAIGMNFGSDSSLQEALPHHRYIEAAAIFLNESNLTHWSAAPTRFSGLMEAFITHADQFTYGRGPGDHAHECPSPDRYALQKAAVRRWLAA